MHVRVAPDTRPLRLFVCASSAARAEEMDATAAAATVQASAGNVEVRR